MARTMAALGAVANLRQIAMDSLDRDGPFANGRRHPFDRAAPDIADGEDPRLARSKRRKHCGRARLRLARSG